MSESANKVALPLAESVSVEAVHRNKRFVTPELGALSRWNEALRAAIGSILSNRLRSGLTVIGIVVGMTVIVLVAALLEGAQSFITQETRALAPDVVRVEKAKFQDFIGDARAWVIARSRRPDLTLEDVRWLRDRLGETIEIGAQGDAALPVRRGNQSLNGIVVQGVTSNISFLSNIEIERGRELTATDDAYCLMR